MSKVVSLMLRIGLGPCRIISIRLYIYIYIYIDSNSIYLIKRVRFFIFNSLILRIEFAGHADNCQSYLLSL
jgi:hypothetical protein